MKKIMSGNDLFTILFVENYDAEKCSMISHYELVESPNRVVATFDSFSAAEQVMKQKTEFWKAMIRKIPLYFEVYFIA